MVEQRGYTIVELVIAISLVGVLAAVATQGGTRGMQGASVGFQQTKAQHLVIACLERLRAAEELPPVGKTELALSPEDVFGLPDARGTQVVRALEPGLVEVRVRLSWCPVAGGTRREETLMTWMEAPR